ncbi:Protein of unknown function [Chitinophaga costaii]|uniref:DUF3822 family protein n=1 Tax=Chitinophaga costaii TaxID=1335309 RepID=A0A1C4E6F5_9BACT|nr:DUF3822 family protein [Chitinophaga costaii]PUZ24297.1 DUF3822 domain-containing protein [Chitinophaga costaii]SCC39101.1 Protein of unknown function [Chitinophaga costaii]
MSVVHQIQPAFTVDDSSLLETDLTTCHLLVLVGAGSFSYVVFEPVENKFLAMKSYRFEPQKAAVAELEMIEQVFDADRLLFTAFRSVLLAFDLSNQTLIPAKFYNSNLKKEYLHLLFPEKMQEAVLTDTIDELEVVNVYGLDKDLVGFLRKEFSTDKVINANTALLRSYVYDRDYQQRDGIVYIEIQQPKVTLTAYAFGRLLCQQEFNFQGGLDIVYYLTNMLRQLNLDEQKAQVKLGGAVTEADALVEELRSFVPQVQWQERLPGFLYIGKMQELPAHYFQNLYALALCV